MLISALSDYTLDSTRDKNRGNKEGAFYKDTLGESWLIKKYPYNDVAVKEDLAGNLFRLLLNGTKHSPETQLIMKKNTDGSSTYLVGSKIRQHYVGFMEMKKESITQYNIAENQRFINNLPIEGLEDIILVSALTREGDFIGNGNVGVDLNPEHHMVNAFRIDFDDAFSNDSIQSIANYTCFGDLLKDLHADRSLKEYRLLNYAKFQQAIQRLSSIDSQTIEQLYSLYKVIFNNMIDEEKDPENKKRLCVSFSRIDQSIENVKNELEKFASLQSHQTTQFKAKFANIKPKSHDGISDNPVHRLINAHDDFFVHSKPDEMLNFSKRLLRQVISQSDVYTPEKNFLIK